MTLALLAAALLCATGPAPRDEGRRLALVIGANDGGPGRERLRYATSDAKAFSRVLQELGGIGASSQVLLLEPTRAQVEGALASVRASVAERVARGAKVELIVYYSGHSDENGLMLGSERLGLTELRRALDAVPAQVRVAILDSCASGEFTRVKGGTRVAPFHLDEANQLTGHAFLTSSSARENAQESDRIGGSFFTHYLVSGLRGAADFTGDGRVTLNEAYQFAFAETLRRTTTTAGGPQHPAYDIELNGRGEFVMTDLHAASAGLSLGKELAGRVYVRDAGQHLVAELQKPAGNQVELGLEPGRYHVMLEREGKTWTAELTLASGAPAQLSPAQLVSSSREATVLRGGEPVRVVPFNLSLVPMVSSNGLLGAEARNYVSFNLLYGRSHSVHGLSVGIFDSQVNELYGASIQGVGSTVGGDFTGLQVAGFGNLVRGSSLGIQIAGTGNVTEAFTGLQVGGSANRATAVTGLQVGGLVNFAGPVTGAQVSGVLNMAGGVRGLQIGLLNVGGDVSGVQVGLVNIASKVSGLQLGLVNVADDVDGVPFGLVSIVRNGNVGVDLWTSDVHPLNVSVRFGSRRVYSFLTLGAEARTDVFHGYSSLGLGYHLPFGRAFLDVDVSAGSLQNNFDFRSPGLAMLNRLRVSGGYQLAEHLTLFGGVAANNFVGRDTEVPALLPLPRSDFGTGRNRVLVWPGLFAGVRL